MPEVLHLPTFQRFQIVLMQFSSKLKLTSLQRQNMTASPDLSYVTHKISILDSSHPICFCLVFAIQSRLESDIKLRIMRESRLIGNADFRCLLIDNERHVPACERTAHRQTPYYKTRNHASSDSCSQRYKTSLTTEGPIPKASSNQSISKSQDYPSKPTRSQTDAESE
jgi:hypothetical protein